jgi:hypothetical protein
MAQVEPSPGFLSPFGASAALVLTGISSEADARACAAGRAPTAILPDVTALPELLDG